MPSRPARLLAVAVLALAAACGSGATASERLAEAIEERTGRSITEAELEVRVAQAERLCILGDDLLGAVVAGRTAIELNIYDAYFDIWCPDRASAYLAVRPGDAIGVGEDTVPASTTPVDPSADPTTSTTERDP